MSRDNSVNKKYWIAVTDFFIFGLKYYGTYVFDNASRVAAS